MSEPYSACLQFEIGRAALVQWLDSKPLAADLWTDWPVLAERYPSFDWDRTPLYDVADCEFPLTKSASIRDALVTVITDINAPFLGRAVYRADTKTFLAGSVLYAESLTSFIEFMAIARSASRFMGADEGGFALIHNYVWQPDTVIGMKIGPGDRSAILPREQLPATVAIFQPVVDEMLSIADRHGEGDNPPPAQNELKALRHGG